MGKVLWDQLHHHRIAHTLPAQIMEEITKLIKDAASCVTVGTVTSTASILILCWLKALAVKSKLAIWFYVGLIGFNNLRWFKALQRMSTHAMDLVVCVNHSSSSSWV